MFDTFMVKALEHDDVVFSEPHLLTITNKEDVKDYSILKGAENYIYKRLKLRPATSNKINKQIWNDLIRDRLEFAETNYSKVTEQFVKDDNYLMYLVDESYNLVDLYNCYGSEEDKQQFLDKLKQFKFLITTSDMFGKTFCDGKDGIGKFIFYRKDADLVEDDYTPVVFVEMNHKSSTYNVYSGIYMYKESLYIPTLQTLLSCDSFSDFVKHLDIDNFLDLSEKSGQQIYDNYREYEKNCDEISVREVVNVLKTIGYKLKLADDDNIAEIDNMTDEDNSMRLQEFFNTFRFTTGESAVAILSLSEIQKIFRYNKLTVIDLLKILSKEYLTYDGCKVTAGLLASYAFPMYGSKTDKQQVTTIQNELNNIM